MKGAVFLMIFLLGLTGFHQTMSETQATEVSGVFYLKTASLISAVGDAEGFRTAVFMIKIINLRQLNEGQFYNVSLNVEISDPYEPDRWVAQLHALDFSYGETPERLVFTWNDTIGSQRVRFLTLTASNVTPPEEDTACRATITAVGSGWVERAYVGALMNSYGTSIAFEDPHQYLVPGYDVDYRFLVANDGRLPDILDLNVSEVPENWTIKFYYQDGITPLNDTNNNGYPDTGVINGSQKMVLIARLKRSSPAPKGEIAKIWVTAISGIMPNQTSSTSLTGVIPGVFFSISDENLRNNGEHPYYGRKFSGHNVNPGENTTYVIKVFNMGSDNPPPVTLNIQDESIPEGWQAFLYFKGVASQTVIVTEEDIPEVGDHVEVLLYVTTPSSASEGDMAEIVVNRVETSEAARFIARVTLTRKVYIINLDGMPPEYVHQELMPNLWKLVEEGSYYTNASAHLIAATAINHVGIIVSADTQTHGILTAGTAYLGWNENRSMPEWRLYEYEDIPVETIYTTIKRSDPNLRTGVVSGKFWIAELFYGPDTDIKAHSYEHPFYIDEPQPYWLGDPNDPETDPTKHTRYISFAGAKGSPSDLYIVETAMEIIRNEDPDFLYVLLANPDVAGHSYGDAYDGSTEINPKANPEAMLDVIENITDKAVGAFMDFLKERGTYEDSIIAVTSDHSMDTMYPEIEVVYEDQTLTGFVHRAIDVREILENEGIVMGEDYEYGTRKGYVAMLYGFKNNETVQQAKSILENYKVIFTNVTGGISVYDENPIWAVLDRETMPEYRLYNELVISGATDREWPELIVLINEHYGGGIGAHGSHSTLPVTLVLHGPNIKKGYVNNVSVRTLDIVPTISRLNGWIYPDGHYFLDHEEEGTVLDCIVEDPIQNYTFQLEEGLNLISPLLTSKLYTAEFLAKAIPNSTSIAYWNSTIQDWVTHPVGTNVSNFKIIEGDALLVNVTAKTSFTIYGYLITEHKITLQTGWNGYGWLSDETITAKELKQIINKELDKPYRVTKVKMLNATTQTWIEYVRGEENNFPVIKGHGYLVYIEKTKGRGASGGGNRRLLR